MIIDENTNGNIYLLDFGKNYKENYCSNNDQRQSIANSLSQIKNKENTTNTKSQTNFSSVQITPNATLLNLDQKEDPLGEKEQKDMPGVMKRTYSKILYENSERKGVSTTDNANGNGNKNSEFQDWILGTKAKLLKTKIVTSSINNIMKTGNSRGKVDTSLNQDTGKLDGVPKGPANLNCKKNLTRNVDTLNRKFLNNRSQLGFNGSQNPIVCSAKKFTSIGCKSPDSDMSLNRSGFNPIFINDPKPKFEKYKRNNGSPLDINRDELFVNKRYRKSKTKPNVYMSFLNQKEKLMKKEEIEENPNRGQIPPKDPANLDFDNISIRISEFSENINENGNVILDERELPDFKNKQNNLNIKEAAECQRRAQPNSYFSVTRFTDSKKNYNISCGRPNSDDGSYSPVNRGRDWNFMQRAHSGGSLNFRYDLPDTLSVGTSGIINLCSKGK